MNEEKLQFKMRLPLFAVYGIISLAILITVFLSALFAVPEGAFLILKGAIGDKHSLLSLSVVALVICGINIAASAGIMKKDRMVSHLLGSLAVFIPAIILLKIATIVFIY
ncbi:MAG: hypothetical protein WC565_00810 [Parcubacteria group bacterium]